MKTFPLLLLIMIFNLALLAQPARHCEVPIPEQVFRQKLHSVNKQPTEALKLQVASAIAINNCLSSEQVSDIAALFIDDYSRLNFAQTAWQNTVDKDNFYFVYDAFAYFSTVFRLHDYIQEMKGHPQDYLPPYEPPLSLNFPAFNYPNYEFYRGPANCDYPIREDDFLNQAQRVVTNTNETNRQLLLNQIARNNCLSAAQAVKLASLLQSEPNRLAFFQLAITSIYDLGNLAFGAQLFAHIPNKAAYNQLISQPLPVDPLPPSPCTVTPDDFSQILQSIRKESFSSTKLTLAKQILRSKQCFSTRQVKEMIELFSFDDQKLEIAKYAWDYTTDRENYYQVADVFSFNSTREKLMKFIEQH